MPLTIMFLFEFILYLSGKELGVDPSHQLTSVKQSTRNLRPLVGIVVGSWPVNLTPGP